MTNVVRLRIRFASASCTSRSDSASSDEVASSRIRIGRVLEDARARSRGAGAGRPRAAGRARRSACRSRSGSVAMNSCACGRARRRFDRRRATRPARRRRCCSRWCRRRAPSPASRCRSARAGTCRVTSRMSMPSIEDRAVGDVVEARDQIHERGLAGAAQPDERDHLAGAHGERHVAQHGRPGAVVVREADVAGTRSPRIAAAGRARPDARSTSECVSSISKMRSPRPSPAECWRSRG